MSDEHSKKVSSTPPPPTDAVDQSWSNTPEPGRVDLGKPVTSTAVAPGVSAQDIRRATRHAEEEELDDDEEEEDEDEDEDSDEDEDEDEHEEAPARALSGTNRSGASNDWLPDWAPYAVLGALVLLGTAGGLGLLGGMAPPRRAAAEEVIQPSKPATATDKQPERQAAPPSPAAAAVAQDSERIEASHLLVAYQGALRVDPKVTRTKEEAKKRAQEALAKAKKGAAFDKLVAEYSDEPRAAERKGALGSFTRRQMVKPFADAAFALKPGQISDVVETNFGFHVIQRTK